jgi:cysteine desulfurase/selenocysteine lyase
MSFDVQAVRNEFPQLLISVRGKGLVYLDNGATTLKPQVVIDRVAKYYQKENANVHRGAHWLAETGTVFYEEARSSVAGFLNATTSSEIVFTRGTTESINLVAQTLASLGADSGPAKLRGLQPGDQVIVSEMEHHSNIVPWQLACQRSGARLVAVRIDDDGDIDLAHLKKLLEAKTAVVAVTGCSNVLATVVNVPAITKLAKAAGAIVVVDAAQSITAGKMDVQSWGADFVAFSGHKLFAPFGIGVLWAKKEWLEILPPYQGGGSMIHTVSFENSTWADVPQKFEAGTPNVGGAVGLAEAIRWLGTVEPQKAFAHAKQLAEVVRQELAEISGIKVYGNARQRTSIVSFNLDGVHASDLGTILDQQGIAIRAGHHCCQPLMRRLGCSSTGRASFSIYNTKQEAAAFIEAVKKAKEILT